MAENIQRLAAPIIEGTVPAFYAQENGTVTLTVPFSMNRAVSKNHIYGFEAKIKNLQGSDFLFPLKTTVDNNNGWDFTKNEVYFEIYVDSCFVRCFGRMRRQETSKSGNRRRYWF